MVAHKEDELPLPVAEPEFVVCEADDPAFTDEHLRGEPDRVDLCDLLCTEFLYHVLGDEFSHVADPGKPLDEKRCLQSVAREIRRETDRHFVHALAVLRYFPYLSSGENLAG